MATSKSLLIAVRVTPEIAAALDRLGANAKLHTPVGPIPLPTRSLTRTEALRIAAEVGLRSLGMLGSDIRPTNNEQQVASTAPPIESAEPASVSDGDSNALRARFKAAMAAKKTGPSKAAEFTECSERSIRRWLKGEATMTPDDSNAISAHLDSING